MWMFTRYGFISAVSARKGDGAHGKPINKNRMMLRARKRAHLEDLAAAYPEYFAKRPIVETNDTDYPFRVFLPKLDWVELATRLADEIDYDNFKGAVKKFGGDVDYLHALHSVWVVMKRLEPPPPPLPPRTLSDHWGADDYNDRRTFYDYDIRRGD